MSILTKQALRSRFKTMRQELSDMARTEASKALCARIQKLPVYQRARHIGLYYAVRGEISLAPLWKAACTEKKTCYMPVTNTELNTLLFLPATPDTPQTRGVYHIPEPCVSHHLARTPGTFDLIITPLVAFDSHGTRLGTGGGYYDRTLAHERPACLLGAGYAFQYAAHLTPEPWDIPLDGIVTEETTYWRTP